MSQVSKESRKSHFLTILRMIVAVLAVLVICVICYTRRHELLLLYKNLPVSVFIAGIGLFIAANIVISFRWYVLMCVQNLKIPFMAVVKVHFLGLFYNNIMVSSVGGDMLRVWYIAKYTDDKRLEAGLSVLVDRVVGLFSLILMAVSFYLFVPVEGLKGQKDSAVKSGMVSRIADHKELFALIAGLLVVMMVLVFVFPPTRKLMDKAFKAAILHFPRVRAAIAVYCKRPFSLILCILFTFIAQALPIIGFYLMGKSMSIPAAFKYYFVFFPLSWVIGAIPISIGGAGVLEFGLAGLFETLPGISLVQGMALALCQRIVFITGSLPGVVIHMTGTHLPSKSELADDF